MKRKGKVVDCHMKLPWISVAEYLKLPIDAYITRYTDLHPSSSPGHTCTPQQCK